MSACRSHTVAVDATVADADAVGSIIGCPASTIGEVTQVGASATGIRRPHRHEFDVPSHPNDTDPVVADCAYAAQGHGPVAVDIADVAAVGLTLIAC